MTACLVCGGKSDAFLCGKHTGEIRKALEALPDLLRELDVTISRQDRGTGAALYAVKRGNVQIPGVDYAEGPGAIVATPWPFSWDAANVRWTVEATVGTWARHLAETRGVGEVEPLPPDLWLDDAWPLIARRRTARLLHTNPGRFLLEHVESIRLDEAAAEIHDEITACQHDARRAIDRQDPDVFAGRCTATDVHVHDEAGVVTAEVSPCGADLFAHTGDDEVKCRACGTEYVLVEQRAKLRGMVDDQWARPQLIADALTDMDEPINAATLRKWIERDRKLHERLSGREAPYPLVLQVGIDDDGKPLYRVGDVRARIAAARERMSA